MRFLLLTLVLAALASAPVHGVDLPEHKVADPLAAPVTEQNLLEADRFWPFHVGIAEPMRLRPEQELPAGWVGVLVRVEPGGRARIDFGRDGVHYLPISATDLVDQANRIRRGELTKMAPNFAATIGTALWNPATNPPNKLGIDGAMRRLGFLLVFADPDAKGFADLAAALRPLADRRGVLTVLFPQGRHSDVEVQRKLLALDWKPTFVLDYLSAGYTASLIDQDTPRPALLLQTAEGRALFQSAWKPDVVPELTRRLDEAFSPPAASTAASGTP